VITDVPGIRVGHWTDAEALTGCTVILPPPGTTGSVHIPGNAPATRETDVIAPGRRVDEPNAILLTGGSAFGLAAADGVMRWLEERGIGHRTPFAVVPIVPTAAIFDLGIGRKDVRPGPEQGYAACDAASDGAFAEGNAGAGTGAVVGGYAGFEWISKGGLGSASVYRDDVIVGAVAVVNSVGDVVEEDGTVVAGARGGPTWDEVAASGAWPPVVPETNTVIACIATNAMLDKDGCHEAAVLASEGFGRAVRPAHTMFDGDAVFVLATGSIPSPADLVGRVGAGVLAASVRRAARAAQDVPGAPARGSR